jgi:hypothetical protein
MRIQRWGVAILVAGTVTLAGATAFAAAPSGNPSGAAGHAACAGRRAGARPWGRGAGKAGKWLGMGGRRAGLAGRRPGMRPPRGMLQAASSYLGLSVQQLRADLRCGQSLDQIADSVPGDSAAGLQAVLQSTLQADLGRAVAAGRLSAAREQRILTMFQSRWPKWMARGGHGSSPSAPGSAAGGSSSSGSSD